MVVHICDPGIGEAEASRRIGSSRLHETLPNFFLPFFLPPYPFLKRQWKRTNTIPLSRKVRERLNYAHHSVKSNLRSLEVWPPTLPRLHVAPCPCPNISRLTWSLVVSGKFDQWEKCQVAVVPKEKGSSWPFPLLGTNLSSGK